MGPRWSVDRPLGRDMRLQAGLPWAKSMVRMRGRLRLAAHACDAVASPVAEMLEHAGLAVIMAVQCGSGPCVDALSSWAPCR